jgi:hypothetical protein
MTGRTITSARMMPEIISLGDFGEDCMWFGSPYSKTLRLLLAWSSFSALLLCDVSKD